MDFSPQFSNLRDRFNSITNRFVKFSRVSHRYEALASADYIAFGPWIGEVGWEVLYWIPYINWVIKQFVGA